MQINDIFRRWLKGHLAFFPNTKTIETLNGFSKI